MAREKGAGIEFGKVSVYASEADLNDVFATFSKVLVQFGYPEEETEYIIDDGEDDEDEEEDNRTPGTEPWNKNN